jgi:hypothetical protein
MNTFSNQAIQLPKPPDGTWLACLLLHQASWAFPTCFSFQRPPLPPRLSVEVQVPSGDPGDRAPPAGPAGLFGSTPPAVPPGGLPGGPARPRARPSQALRADVREGLPRNGGQDALLQGTPREPSFCALPSCCVRLHRL